MSDKYNGWTNFETWNVALWMGNDESSDGYSQSLAQECWDEAEAGNHRTREEVARYNIAEQLREQIAVENQPDLGASMYADLLSAALSEVNWDEIAGHLLDEVDREVSVDG